MTNTLTISREALLAAANRLSDTGQNKYAAPLWEALAAPVVERQETVPKHKFDTLVQHCKRLDAEIAQSRTHVNEITLYQQNVVWFWQHDGEDYLQSLSCPIIIQPHHLRELLEGKAQYNPIASQPAPVAVVLPDDWEDQLFAEMERRFDLRKQIDDDHMVNDDTQVGVEFARDWIAAQLDKVKEMNQ